MTDDAAEYLLTARRVVIKIGSSLLVDQDTGALKADWLASLADDVAALKRAGKDVAIVSSGSIALGRPKLGMTRARLKLEEKQAAAAVGQAMLVNAYDTELARHDIMSAQVLVTLAATENRRQYLNARSTLATLFKMGVVPVINENDTVATEEIRYGDNDRLAARVAQMISADCLVLLSDVSGLYTADPGIDPGAELVPVVARLTDNVFAMAGASRSGVGSGGMTTKLMAAEIALGAGCHMAITDGRVQNPVKQLLKDGTCTWFVAEGTPRTARKQWIAATLEPSGSLVLDDGAVRALASGKSLLPAGVKSVDGEFDRGEAVWIRDPDGRALARGLVAYSARDARRIAGFKSGEIENILGYRGRDEIVHRDDLVLVGTDQNVSEDSVKEGAGA